MKRLFLWILIPVLLVGAGGDAAAKDPPSALPRKDKGETTEYRFDALRIDGTLHGPEALDVRSMTGARRTPLMKRRTSFVHRIFETMEDPTLHGG